mgnify:CR=1 FL=1
MAATSKILVEGFVNKQIFPRTKVKSGDFAIFTFSPDNIKGEIDPRTKENKGGYKSNDKGAFQNLMVEQNIKSWQN